MKARHFEFLIPKSKYELVYEILKRWWYCMPDWPDKNYDYKPLLEEKKLRLVSKENFRLENETDAQGRAKVHEVDGYPGIFQDSKVGTR